MRITLLLTLVAACAGCASRQPAPQAPARTVSSYCSQPLRGETISGPLAPASVPAGVAGLAKDRFRQDLQQEPPTGGWYQGSDGSYLFCSHRLAQPKACDSERQFYRLNGEVWEAAENDYLSC